MVAALYGIFQFHRYYLIMLGPPIAALVGITLWSLSKHWKKNHALGWLVAAIITGLTIIFEIYTFRNYPDYAGWVTAIIALIWLVGIGILALSKQNPLHKVGFTLVLIGMLVAPFTWSVWTSLNTNPGGLPTAGIETSDFQTKLNDNGRAILDYLLTNTDPDDYLLATLSVRSAAPFILETGRVVLTFGGFSGKDNVVGVDDLIEMIENGELRYILGLPQQKLEIAQWMLNSCSVVDLPGVTATPQFLNIRPNPGGQTSEVLYDCGGT